MNVRSPSPRGTARLLRDCALFGRLFALDRPPARRRLELELGERLAQLILAEPRLPRPR
jgi:hypothetical protein